MISIYSSALLFPPKPMLRWKGILAWATSPSSTEAHTIGSLEDIHLCVKEINSRLWRELRTGVLAGCYVSLHMVLLTRLGEHLDWREVNRRTVSALHRFQTSDTAKEQSDYLQKALDCIRNKLLIVQLAAIRKAERMGAKEAEAIQRYRTELNHLSLRLETQHLD